MTTIRSTAQVPPQYAIKQIPGYQTHDGQKFHKLEDAQNHTKDSLILGIFEALCRTEHRFSRIDAGLFKDAVKRIGVQIAQVIQDPMEPARTVGKAPELGMPYETLHDPKPGEMIQRAKDPMDGVRFTARAEDVVRQSRAVPNSVKMHHIPESDPLKVAMGRVDAKEAEIAENDKKLAEIRDLAKAEAEIADGLKFLAD